MWLKIESTWIIMLTYGEIWSLSDPSWVRLEIEMEFFIFLLSVCVATAVLDDQTQRQPRSTTRPSASAESWSSWNQAKTLFQIWVTEESFSGTGKFLLQTFSFRVLAYYGLNLERSRCWIASRKDIMIETKRRNLQHYVPGRLFSILVWWLIGLLR